MSVRTALLLSTFLLAACNGILGIEDAQLADGGAAGQTATGGGAGSGGVATGGAGTGGSGTAGAGGTSTGGAGGTPGCQANLQSDPLHCGRCNHSCLGGDCTGGQCQPQQLTSTGNGPLDAELAGGALLVTSYQNSTLYRIDVSSLVRDEWLVGGGATPSELAVHGAFAYFVDGYQDVVYRAPIDGSTAPTQFVSVAAGLEAVAADASGVYFNACGTTREVVRSDLAGNTREGVITSTDCPEVMKVDATHLVYTTFDRGAVYRVAKADLPVDAPAAFASAGEGTRALALSASHVYFATWDGSLATDFSSNIYRVSLDGNQVTPLASGRVAVYDMVVDGDTLWFSEAGHYTQDWADGRVARLDLATPGAAPVVIASDRSRPTGIVADAQAVYWVETGTASGGPGSVWRVAK